ncbi:hypothetical protein ACHQM5_021601 [Ranunculus cassubicifolius]
MEKFQQKPKGRTFSTARDNANLVQERRNFGPGNLQVRRRSEDLDIISDCSCSSYSTEEDSFSYKLRRGGVRQASEAPMKKLLADELSKEAEVRRRPPSVIGRLMGLDALPPQQPVKKHQKKFSENYLKKTASIGCLDKRYSHEGRSHRTSIKEHQEFKDVYEVLESSEDKKHPNSLMHKERMHSYANETKMEYVRQKFMDVKRLSTDQNLHQSKEFHDALEVLDSNKDLLLRFLQEPDSLFTKHLRDLHGVPSPPQPGHITVLHSSAQDNLYRKPDRKTEAANSSQNYEQGSISHSRRKNVYIPSKVPKSQLHEKDVTSQLPTRIVVLKPNLKKVQNTERMISSPDSLEGFPSGHRKNKEFGSSESLDYFEEIRHRRDPSIELEHRTRGSRQMAKEITRQMRHGIRSRSKTMQTSRHMRYSGDESSHSWSGNDSANESEVKTPTSRHLSDLKCRYSPSSSFSTESSVSREARKRLSERWKMMQRAQDVRKGSRGNTLGEMLALPDKEATLNSSDPVYGPDGLSDKLSGNGGVTRCGTPLGISSKDGWKDEYVRSLPRSRSLPASSTSLSSPKTSTGHGSLRRCSIPKESVNWLSNMPRNTDSPQSDDFFLRRKTKSSRKKSYSFAVSGEKIPQGQCSDLNLNEQRCADAERSHPVLDADLKPDELTLSFEEMDLHEWKPSNLEVTVEDISETIPSVNVRELSADIVTSKSTPVDHTEGSSISYCTITEAESPASSKEAEQPSPVSVLEPPFVDECSPSSNSFEQISADLHGLRMQLQLLKSETSDAYSEGSEMIVSSDEDITEANKRIRGEVNRDFSYITDVLFDSHFHNSDLDVLRETWYSPELAIAPSVFDKLEKKYGEQHMSWLRSDRKLLFDRLNLGLMELLQPYTDPHPWVHLGKKISQWNGENVGEEVWKLLVRQEKEVEKDSQEKELLREMNWLDLGDDVNGVGNEIERLLLDDLVVEVVVSLVVV